MRSIRPARPARLAAIAALLAAVSAVLATLVSASPGPSELFFSEYVEGSGSNKALEIYNGTGAPVMLDGVYAVELYANGSATATSTIPLTGTIADGDAFVLVRSAADPALVALGDQLTTNFLYNGNDAVALVKDGTTVVDVIGQVGVDPGVEWGSGDTSTADATIRRKAAVLVGDANGSDPFDPAVEWVGFPINTFDGLGSHAIDTGPGGDNAAPSAGDDAVTVEEDGGPAIVTVLANDTDPDGDALALAAVGDPGFGTAAADGATVVYVPDADFNGGDSFSYTVSDGRGGSDTATVTVTVLPANDDPDAEDDTATTPEDTSVTIPVLANDEDVDGDALTVEGVEDPAGGSVSVSPDGSSLVYTPPADASGSEVFAYTVTDGDGVDTGLVTVTIEPVNDPPVAVPDSLTVPQGSSTVADVLANDSPGPADESGQPLAVAGVGSPSHGAAELVTTGPDAGRIRYTPAPGYVGPDSFAYVVGDGSLTATGLVSVTVLPGPARPPCSLEPTIVGTVGDDVIVGTPSDDVIHARRGDDVIDGNGGNDVVCAGPGADTVSTGDGVDRIAAGPGADSVSSGGGADRVRGGFGADHLAAGGGDDVIAAGPGDDDVDAGDGRNAVSGGRGDDRLVAGSGDDRLHGGAGADTCDADGGRNTVVACEG